MTATDARTILDHRINVEQRHSASAGWLQDCPYCGITDSQAVTHDVLIVSCRRCGLYRPSLRMDRAAQTGYFSEINARIDIVAFDSPVRLQRTTQWEINLLKRWCPSLFRRGRVLDVGTAEGTFLASLNRAGALGVGLEPVVRLAEYARSHGLDVRTARFTRDSIPSDLFQEPFDLICFRECWYYLPDLKETFDLLRALLIPGGYIYIKATQGRSIYFRFWPDYLARYNPSVQGIPTPAALHYILTQERFRIRYAGAYPEHTLRIFNAPVNKLTRLLGLIVDPVARPLLHGLSRHDRLVFLASLSSR